MTTSLVTGGAGFIGSHLVQALLARGDYVRVLDNFSTGKRENLSGMNGRLEVHEGDLRDQEQVIRAVQGVDQVFHQAAFVSVPLSMQDPTTCFDINVTGTVRLLEAARKAGAQAVVLASSAAVYGDNQDLPVRESAPCQALSPYAASKQTDEVYADMYTRVYGLPVTALRYFNVYGPRQSPLSDYAAAIPIFINRMMAGKSPIIFGDGFQARDFVYVEDVVAANLLAAQNDRAAGGVFNICTGRQITIRDLINTLQQVLEADLEPEFTAPRAGDIYLSYGDPGLAADVLRFQAQTPLAEGLTRTAAWVRS